MGERRQNDGQCRGSDTLQAQRCDDLVRRVSDHDVGQGRHDRFIGREVQAGLCRANDVEGVQGGSGHVDLDATRRFGADDPLSVNGPDRKHVGAGVRQVHRGGRCRLDGTPRSVIHGAVVGERPLAPLILRSGWPRRPVKRECQRVRHRIAAGSPRVARSDQCWDHCRVVRDGIVVEGQVVNENGKVLWRILDRLTAGNLSRRLKREERSTTDRLIGQCQFDCMVVQNLNVAIAFAHFERSVGNLSRRDADVDRIRPVRSTRVDLENVAVEVPGDLDEVRSICQLHPRPGFPVQRFRR